MKDTDEYTVLEITCPDCASEYELAYDEDETEEPVYCPFCGTDLPDSVVEEGTTENEDDFSDYIEDEDDNEDDQ